MPRELTAAVNPSSGPSGHLLRLPSLPRSDGSLCDRLEVPSGEKETGPASPAFNVLEPEIAFHRHVVAGFIPAAHVAMHGDAVQPVCRQR